jgi:NarL family two-component system response regulator LiaR
MPKNEVKTMSDTATIRVMLVDDHAIVRSGLAAFVTTFEDLQLVGEAENGEEAIRFCERMQPDVILMDLQMPRIDGVAATRYLRQHFPQVQILILTSYKEDQLIQDALEAGAIGYLLKNVGSSELADAIRAVYHERPALAPEAARALINASNRRHAPMLGDDLTEREREVLRLVSKGYDNQRIADSLVVSQATVKFHVGNILSKLHASSRTEAVAIALEHKIVSNSGL